MELIKGRKIANGILTNLRKRIRREKLKPGLAVILIGEDRASKIYVKLKEKAARKIGVVFSLFKFGKNIQEEKIISKIKELNKDDKVHGILVQLPMPAKFNTGKIIDSVDYQKDADGFSSRRYQKIIKPVFPSAIIKMLESLPRKYYLNKKALIIANSKKFGEVMVIALKKNKIKADYILLRKIKIPLNPPFEKGENLPSSFIKGPLRQVEDEARRDGEGFLKKVYEADIIITACGVPGLIKGEMIKKGAIIIDGGITKIGQKVLGDVDIESVKNIAGFLTPVPGGVGPVTVATLMENVYQLASKQSE